MSFPQVTASKNSITTDHYNIKHQGENDKLSQRPLKLNMRCVILLVCITNLFIVLFLNGFISLDITEQSTIWKIAAFKKSTTETQADVINFDWLSNMDSEGLVFNSNHEYEDEILLDSASLRDQYSKQKNHDRTLNTFSKCQDTSFPISGREQIGPPLVKSDSISYLSIVEEELHRYNINDPKRIACCYRPFWLNNNTEKLTLVTPEEELVTYSRRCFRFDGLAIKIPLEKEIEFVEIKCYKKFGGDPYVKSLPHGKHEVKIHRDYIEEVYRDYHAFVPNKKTVEERCMKQKVKDDEVSVLMLGIDAVSRLNMLRELPLLHSVLTSPPLSAISLLGYNKVGDNTFPNVMPILTGLAEDELKDVCPWPSAKHKLDPCPFIWKDFANRGYRTACGEDDVNTSNFHFMSGFSEAPTDYYLSPFFFEADKHIGHLRDNSSNLCIGPRFKLLHSLNYIENFTKQFSTKKSFGYFSTSPLSNDNFTATMDQLYSNLLNNLISSQCLDRTVLIVFSTGNGKAHENFQNGDAQMNQPMFYISFPSQFRERYRDAMQNIKFNAKNHLTSPFDIYKTLQDLLDPSKYLNKNTLMAREKMLRSTILSNTFSSTLQSNKSLVNFKEQRGISLFLPIPDKRTCSSAGVPARYCGCKSSSEIRLDAKTTRHVAQYIVGQINFILEKYPQCAQHQLADIIAANRSIMNRDKPNNQRYIYSLKLVTSPSDYIFQSNVHISVDIDQRNKTELHLIDKIIRVYNNEKRDSNECVFHDHIKQFCYCIL